MKFLPVTPDRWSDLEQLFESRGGPKHCWCMVFRPMTIADRRAGRPAKKSAISKTVAAGTPVGILAYDSDEPVAWCSIAPLAKLTRTGPARRRLKGVWSLPCFFVRSDIRRQGLTRQLITAAINYAEDPVQNPSKQSSKIHPEIEWASLVLLRRIVRTLDTLRIMMRLHL